MKGINWPLVAFRARFATVSMVEGDDPAGRRAASIARLTVEREFCPASVSGVKERTWDKYFSVDSHEWITGVDNPHI